MIPARFTASSMRLDLCLRSGADTVLDEWPPPLLLLDCCLRTFKSAAVMKLFSPVVLCELYRIICRSTRFGLTGWRPCGACSACVLMGLCTAAILRSGRSDLVYRSDLT